MLYVFVCTEGQSSELGYIKALINKHKSQVPLAKSALMEVIPLSLDGNQGHTKLFDKANQKITSHMLGLYGVNDYLQPNDKEEKWLICDYDNMDKNRITMDSLQKEAVMSGYKIIINKPNFEYFTLLNFLEPSKVINIKTKDFISEINKQVKIVNERNKIRFPNTDCYVIPNYNKKIYCSNLFFDRMLSFAPLANKIFTDSDTIIDSENRFSEMGKIINRVKKLYS